MLRILIVDDDLVSLRFLEAATLRLGHQVIALSEATTAADASLASNFSLLIIDRNMPGLTGVSLLRRLRAQGTTAPAIATSAELDTAIRAELGAAGFMACLHKPLTIEDLRVAIDQCLGTGSTKMVRERVAASAMVILDDAAALQAIGGDRAVLVSLRGLFAHELGGLLSGPTLLPSSSTSALIDRLHRLRASCGFCGAPALAAAAQQFELALRNHDEGIVESLRIFKITCARTLAALDTHAG